MEKSTSVKDYITKNTRWKNELELLRNIISKTALQETIKWGFPVYTIAHKNVLGLAAFKDYFGIWFFNGALLKDTHKVLVNAREGKTKAMRQWRFKHIDEVDEQLVLSYVREAVSNQEKGREIKPETHKIWTIPAALEDILKKDENLYHAYHSLTPYKQREYAQYIDEAKQSATKQKRLKKIKPMILQGIGLVTFKK